MPRDENAPGSPLGRVVSMSTYTRTVQVLYEGLVVLKIVYGCVHLKTLLESFDEIRGLPQGALVYVTK